MSKALDPGAWAESQSRAWMNNESGRIAGFAFHRYPDAKAARGSLAAQPADFLLSSKQIIYHLETKETQQVRRLPKSKIRQYGQLKKWWWANIQPRVVIYRSECNDWVWLGPEQLFEFEDCPASFPLFDRPTFPTCTSLMESLFS